MTSCTSGWRTTSTSVKLAEGDPLDALEDPRAPALRPRGLAAGQVHLGDVAGDHGLAVEAEPGEEHLHLLDGGVLRLVEDDEGVVEGAAAHERQRRDLDRAPARSARAACSTSIMSWSAS